MHDINWLRTQPMAKYSFGQRVQPIVSIGLLGEFDRFFEADAALGVARKLALARIEVKAHARHCHTTLNLACMIATAAGAD